MTFTGPSLSMPACRCRLHSYAILATHKASKLFTFTFTQPKPQPRVIYLARWCGQGPLCRNSVAFMSVQRRTKMVPGRHRHVEPMGEFQLWGSSRLCNVISITMQWPLYSMHTSCECLRIVKALRMLDLAHIILISLSCSQEYESSLHTVA